MAYGVPDLSYDRLPQDDRSRAEELVRSGGADLRRRFYGAEEELHSKAAYFEGVGARKTAANARTEEARQKLVRRRAEFRAKGHTATDDDLVAELEELARAETSEAAADAEYAKGGPAVAEPRVVFNKAALLLAKVHGAGSRIRPHRVTLGRGDVQQQLTANLARQAQNVAEGKRVHNALTPIPVLKEALNRQLDALMAKDPFRLGYADGEPQWRHPVVSLPAEHKLPGRIVTTDDLLPLLFSVLGDEVRSKLMARIDADHEGDDSLRMTKDEKRKRLSALKAELLELQYVEGALRVLLAGDAAEIAFRAEMDPLAVLGIEVID